MKWDVWIGNLSHEPVLWIKHLVYFLGRRIDLHKIIRADQEQCFHTHPARAIRIILWGGYDEQLEDGTIKEWRPGMVGYVAPELSHRIHRVDVSYSLWIRGRRRHKIHLRGEGW